MKRTCIILVSLLCLTACSKGKGTAPPVTTTETINIATTASNIVTTASTTTTAAKEQPETKSTIITSKTKETTTKKSATSTSTKNLVCTHLSYCEATQCPQRFEKGHLHIFGGLGYDAKPGIENAIVFYPNCTNQGERLYKCPVCSEVVFVEYLEPRGHDFTGEEIIDRYPTTKEEGAYIKKCNNFGCFEKMVARTIPKRDGDYSTIASCFTVEYHNGEWYTIEELDISVIDKRTYGKVPTIDFDYETYLLTIEYVNQHGAPSSYQVYIDKNFHDNWEWFSCSVNENGTVDSKYHRLGVNGTAS